MRTHGTLSKWNSDRGIGFISPASGRPDVFVHISAFPRDGIPPRIGELLSFEALTGADGKTKAVSVFRPGAYAKHRQVSGARMRPPVTKLVLGTTIVVALAVGGLSAYRTGAGTSRPMPLSSPSSALPASEPAGFACDGRTRCSQMKSREEALYFIQHCPNTQMDGDHDGNPCEQQF